MGQRRTLLNKNKDNPRKPSLKKGTPYRRGVVYVTDAGTHQVTYRFHTTKGRVRWDVVKKPVVAEVAE